LKDIWVAIIAATLLTFAARVLRQPFVIAFIAAGVIIGPLGFGYVQDLDSIQILSELGLVFLLFIVGLEVDIKKLLSIGKAALPVTVVQVIGSALVVYLAMWAMDDYYKGMPGVYIAIAAAFSSTMISVKLLTDRAELESAHGQMTLGVLLLQDLAAIGVLALQPNFGKSFEISVVVFALAKGAALVVGALVIAKYALPPIFKWIASMPDLVLIAATSWCFAICFLAIKLEFSYAMGALIAGVSMSTFPYAMDVIAKLRGLRSFFVTLFFVSLGLLLQKPTWGMLVSAMILSAIVVVSRMVTVWPTMRALRYTPRVGLLSSIYLGQISEFGLVIALIGVSAPYEHITSDIVSLIVLVMIMTSAASSYLIQYSHQIASRVVPPATSSPGDPTKSTVIVHDDLPPVVTLVGCFRVGSSLVHELRQASIDFKVVDVSQNVNEKLNKLGVNTVYGDLSHLDTLEHAGVEHSRILICSISDDFLRGTDNMRLLHGLRKLAPEAKIIVTAESIRMANDLYKAGADYVIVTRVLVARHLIEVISEIGAGILDERRDREIKHLANRSEVVP